MTSRRKFITKTGMATAGLGMANHLAYSNILNKEYVSQRPPKEERLFTCPIIEEVITETKSRLENPKTAWLFENCFPNTLDTTVLYREEKGRPLTHIITGDIDAMWLRDSTCQVWPYIPYANQDEKLKTDACRADQLASRMCIGRPLRECL